MTDQPTEYVITLKPTKGMDDQAAVRALRRMLKFALRTCRLRAVRVEPAPSSEKGTLT